MCDLIMEPATCHRRLWWSDPLVIVHFLFWIVFKEKSISRRRWLRRPSFFLKNGPTPAAFCLFSFFSNTNYAEKGVGFRGIQTRSAGVEGENADHLTTTTAPKRPSLHFFGCRKLGRFCVQFFKEYQMPTF